MILGANYLRTVLLLKLLLGLKHLARLARGSA